MIYDLAFIFGDDGIWWGGGLGTLVLILLAVYLIRRI